MNKNNSEIHFKIPICCQVRTIRSNSSGDTKWNHVLIVAKIFLIMGECFSLFIYLTLSCSRSSWVSAFLYSYILHHLAHTSRSDVDLGAYFHSNGLFKPRTNSRRGKYSSLVNQNFLNKSIVHSLQFNVFVQVRIVLDILNLLTGVTIFAVLVCKVSQSGTP